MEAMVKRIRRKSMCFATNDLKLFLKKSPDECLELTPNFCEAYVTNSGGEAAGIMEKCLQNGMDVAIKNIRTDITIS